MNEQNLKHARDLIYPLLTTFIRKCFAMHNLNNLNRRDYMLDLIEMCINTLMELQTEPKEIETIIVSLGFRAFPHNFPLIEWYINQILPGYLEDYEQIDMESRTSYSTDDESVTTINID